MRQVTRLATGPVARLTTTATLDAVMDVSARMARRMIDVRRPRGANLSRDERHPLQAASRAQPGDDELAERVLRTALLTAQGAEFALGPWEGFADILAVAGQFLRRRRSPPQDRCAIGSLRPPASTALRP